MKNSVVAVHGIGAHPNTTWTHKRTGKNWLCEPSMLPSDLPNARIMGFGYHSVWYGESPVRKSLSGVANSLVKALVHERRVGLMLSRVALGRLVSSLTSIHECRTIPSDPSSLSDIVSGVS